jgi:hypothetical protein
MKPLALTFILSFCLATPTVAQPSGGSSFFPISLDNWWQLAAIDDSRPDVHPDTIDLPVYQFEEEMTVAGNTYFRFSVEIIDSDTLRADVEGRIWSYAQGQERLLLDFTAGHDSVYTYNPDYLQDSEYQVQVLRDVTVETYVGTFEGCITFSFDIPEALYDEFSYTFAPGVGLVVISGDWAYGVLF